MKRLLVLLSMICATSALPAHADLLLEPYAGYYFGKMKVSGTNTDAKTTGPGLGARVGYQTLGFMVGADYMTGMWTDDSNPKNDITPNDLGVFVGYNFPILVRAYLTYVPTSKLKAKNSSATSDLEGNSMKFGVGFTALPMVSINVEYIKGTYDKANGAKLTNKYNTDSYGLSVSLPLTF